MPVRLLERISLHQTKKGGMLIQDRTTFRSRLRPFLLGHSFFVLLIFSFFYLCQAELQRSCSQPGSQKGGEHCPLLCHCRIYPPLPPPPPPPLPPRLLIHTVAAPPVLLPLPWWMDFIVVGTVGCTAAFLLLLTALLCYKAIKRKPLKKQENGCGEYTMSSHKKKTKRVCSNNVLV